MKLKISMGWCNSRLNWNPCIARSVEDKGRCNKIWLQMYMWTILHADELPREVIAEICIKDAEKTIKSRSYPSPQKYKEVWQILIQQHLDAGHIHPSSSPCASPAFIVPKSNPNVLPCWVNDFCLLNENTITNSHPLPQIDDILNDCAKGKIWGTINMMNSFVQTRMHTDHIHLTAVNTPLELYKWLVMPMASKMHPPYTNSE